MTNIENVVYTVSDLEAAKAVHIALSGVEPHSDQPYYVGFNIQGFEVGFTPARPDQPTSTIAHLNVPDINAAINAAKAAGATVVGNPRDVGGGTRVATVRDAGGTVYGLISHATDEA